MLRPDRLRDPAYFVDSLIPQRTTLRTLYLTKDITGFNDLEADRADYLAKTFATFTKLESLTLDSCSRIIGQSLCQFRGLPPSLKKLRLIGESSGVLLLPLDKQATEVRPWIVYAGESLASLQSIDLVSRDSYPKDDGELVAAGQALKQKGVLLSFYHRTGHGAIPPFLYGETPYEDELIYDSDRGVVVDKWGLRRKWSPVASCGVEPRWSAAGT